MFLWGRSAHGVTSFGQVHLRQRIRKFEFSSAAILRPWFTSDVFRARFWRFGDTSRALSDGKAPPKGSCPAYVTVVVFARNVKVVKDTAAGLPPSTSFEGLRFTTVALNQPRLAQLSTNVLREGQPLRAEVIPPKTKPIRVENRNLSRTVSMAAVRQPVGARALSGQPSANLSKLTVTRLGSQQLLMRPRTGVRPPSGISVPPPPGVVVPIPVQPALPAPVDNRIYILAFICKAVPKSPDPDVSLQWD